MEISMAQLALEELLASVLFSRSHRAEVSPCSTALEARATEHLPRLRRFKEWTAIFTERPCTGEQDFMGRFTRSRPAVSSRVSTNSICRMGIAPKLPC